MKSYRKLRSKKNKTKNKRNKKSKVRGGDGTIWCIHCKKSQPGHCNSDGCYCEICKKWDFQPI
jgi:hypothetical protein